MRRSTAKLLLEMNSLEKLVETPRSNAIFTRKRVGACSGQPYLTDDELIDRGELEELVKRLKRRKKG